MLSEIFGQFSFLIFGVLAFIQTVSKRSHLFLNLFCPTIKSLKAKISWLFSIQEKILLFICEHFLCFNLSVLPLFPLLVKFLNPIIEMNRSVLTVDILLFGYFFEFLMSSNFQEL